jgi:hypothetical protein
VSRPHKTHVVISGRAAVYPESPYLPSDHRAVPVTDPALLRSLDGYDAELDDDELTDDFDVSLESAGLRDGTLRFAFDEERQELRAVSEFRAKRPLTDEELALLVKETVGAWSDGLGENGFECDWEGGSGRVYPNPPGYPLGDSGRDLRVEQLPE